VSVSPRKMKNATTSTDSSVALHRRLQFDWGFDAPIEMISAAVDPCTIQQTYVERGIHSRRNAVHRMERKLALPAVPCL
jgi:hypothetical protein